MREFLWSEDMADACVYLMEKRDFKDTIIASETKQFATNESPIITSSYHQSGEIRNTHINIGTGKDISIKDLAELIKKIIGFNGALYFNSSKPDGTLKKLTDPTKLHQLGWKHSIELEEGVIQMCNWYCDNKNN
jgi:GDP-L-fucose synthase